MLLSEDRYLPKVGMLLCRNNSDMLLVLTWDMIMGLDIY